MNIEEENRGIYLKTRDIKKDLKTFCEILCLLLKESDFQIVSTNS